MQGELKGGILLWPGEKTRVRQSLIDELRFNEKILELLLKCLSFLPLVLKLCIRFLNVDMINVIRISGLAVLTKTSILT